MKKQAKSQTTTVVLVNVGQAPQVLNVVDMSLSFMQHCVGGYIEHVRLHNKLAIICNEEGRLIPLPFNRMVQGHSIFGNFLFVRDNPRTGDFDSLTEDDIQSIMQLTPATVAVGG